MRVRLSYENISYGTQINKDVHSTSDVERVGNYHLGQYRLRDPVGVVM